MNRKIINKSALSHNVNFFKSFAPKICAVVKANAYGHGMSEVVSALKDQVDFFGVSSIEEAQQVALVAPKAKIIVLSKVNDFSYLDKFYLTATSIGDVKKAIAKGKTERCFIKLCTGMNRFGIDCKNQNLLEKLKKMLKNHEFAGFSAHFSSISNEKVTKQEYELFFKARTFLERAFPICFGGSGAKKMPCDILRVGLGIYGYGDKHLERVMSLQSEVLQIRTLEKGEQAGYDQCFKAKRRTTLAVVSAGYGDGFSRNCTKGLKVEIDGKKFDVVGTLCMDCAFVDVTGGDVRPGDRVLMMDDAEHLAKLYGKITYEVLTGFNNFRGKRINTFGN